MSFIGKFFKRKPKQKETVIDLIFTLIGSWLLSVGTALILDSQFTIQIGIKDILWQTAVVTVAVFLVSRRWWIPIIYFGILIPVFFLTVSISGDLISFLKSIASFFSWWLGGMSIESAWYNDQGYYLIHTCMNIGVSVMYFAIARITKKVWISVAVALAFVGTNYAFGYTGYHILTIPFLVVGIFPLIAGDKFQNIRVPDFKNVFGMWGKKWLMIAVSTVIAVLVCATALFVMANTEGSVRTRFCTDIIFDFQTVSDTYNNEQRKVKLNVFDLGLAQNSTYVGGNLFEIPEGVVATTNLKKATRIKITTFDKFDGQNWVSNFETVYRMNGFLWNEEQKSFLSTYLLDDENFMKDIEQIAQKSKVTFTMKAETNFLPTVGQIISFKENTPTKNTISFDKGGRVVSLYGQDKEYSYTIETLNYDTNSSSIEAQMNSILGKYSYLEDPLYDKDSEFYKHYTEPLFETLPGPVNEELLKIKNKEYNEFQKAYKINNYFSKNGFSYVKKPDLFKKGDNIVEKLFSTKRGHCMYYATAMVAMARECGIPSRLVAGYVTIPLNSKKKQIVDLSSPYAWVECYIPNIGWVSFDPSPNNSQSISQKPQNLGQQGELPDVEVEQNVEEKDVSGTNLKWSTDFLKALPLIITAVAVGFVILLLIIYIMTSQSYYKLERVRKRFKTTDRQAEYYYADILRQFRWLGFKLKKGETIRETSDKVCDILQEGYAKALNDAITTVEALYYGQEKLDDTQVYGIYNARRLLENVLKDRNNVFMYTVKRRMLLPIFDFRIKRLKER